VTAADDVFCEILAGTRPAHVVLDEAEVVAFLDARPVFPGHCLVVPRAHVETIEQLPPDLLGVYFAAVQRVAVAVRTGMSADGTFVAINNRVSQSVAHLHTHVVPRRFKDGLRGFFWPRQRYEDDAAMAATASAIAGALVTAARGD
jgi:histidine triad (HIT) family protein